MEATAESAPDVRVPKTGRIDWRTGRPMVVQDAVFWKQHEARRVEQKLSIRQYCEANGLALSTFRRRAAERGSARSGARSGPMSSSTGEKPTAATFVAIGGAARTAEPIAVQLETAAGLRVRLEGAAAERFMQQLLARLP